MEKTDVTKARLLALAAEEGLASKQGRIQCPARCCDDARGASISEPNGYAVWHCQHCKTGGSAIDLLACSRSLSADEAIKILRGRDAPAVASKPPPQPVDAARVWAAGTDNDPAGLLYLRGRGLDAAADKAFVRFNVGRSGEQWPDRKASEGYRVAMPLFDATGQLRSLQLRAVRPCEVPKLSLPGSYPCHLAFGAPLAARTAGTVHLAEGIADTLALQLAGFTVLGAPGSRQARHLVEFVGEPAGREFVLCRQRDPNPTGQRDADEAFAALAASLTAQGGRVRSVLPPEGTKDPAEWLQRAGMEQFRGLLTGPRVVPAPAKAEPPRPKPSATTAHGSAAVAQLPAPQLRSFATKSYASICAILRTPAALAKVATGPLEWNEMLGSPTLARKPVDDAALSSIRERIEIEFKNSKGIPIRPSDSDLAKAIVHVASEKPYHPVADWLRTLHWDGVERIASVADEVLGVERTALTQALLRKWFISAAARALTPGCKVDLVWILQGKQGTRKSTFFNVLAGDDWFSDSPIDLHDKDSKILLRRVWLLEWAELEAMQRSARASSAKAFISSRVDHYRPPYGRGFVSSPRHCVIVGTTNEDEILEDATGNRRYWILHVPGDIDVDTLAGWRDQLWAEAVTAFVAGEAWHVTPEEQAQLEEQHEQWRKIDPWEAKLHGWLVGRVASYLDNEHRPEAIDLLSFTTSEALEHGISKPTGQWSTADARRVAAALKDCGLTQRRLWTEDEARPRGWVIEGAVFARLKQEAGEKRAKAAADAQRKASNDPNDPDRRFDLDR